MHNKAVSSQQSVAGSRKISTKRIAIFLMLTAAYCLLATAASAQSTGSVKGRVRSFRGDTISGATVTARQNSQDVKSVTSNAKGEFNLSGLEPGIYNFVFEAKGYASGLKSGVEIKAGSTKDLGDKLYLNLDRGSRVIVQGSVFFKDGTSVPRAKVEIAKISGGATRTLLTTFTSYSGEFGFSQPDTGSATYRVTATYKDSTVTKDVEVTSPAVYRTALNLNIDRPEKP
jgi:hypothetical protein